MMQRWFSPWAAPDRSTELCSDASVSMSHGSRSSKQDSPIPFTIAPRALADTVRTWWTDAVKTHSHLTPLTPAGLRSSPEQCGWYYLGHGVQQRRFESWNHTGQIRRQILQTNTTQRDIKPRATRGWELQWSVRIMILSKMMCRQKRLVFIKKYFILMMPFICIECSEHQKQKDLTYLERNNFF